MNLLLQSIATGITKVEDNFYICGYEDTSATTQVVKFWRNGVVTNITDGTKSAYASSIFVSGSDVYIAGHEKNAAGLTVAKYWKNGNPVNLTDGTNNASINSIFISGSDVYTCGYEYNSAGFSVAKYWKNDMANVLGIQTEDSSANSIAVDDTNVHVSGSGGGYNPSSTFGFSTLYWKNSLLTILNTNETAVSILSTSNFGHSIFLDGTDVYVSGGISDDLKPIYYKNGVQNTLIYTGDEQLEWITSLFILNNKVYAGGYGDSYGNGYFRPIIWSLDTFSYPIPFSVNELGKIYSIYVVN